METEIQDKAELLGAFRDAMRHVAATVFAVTATHKDRRFGILATAVNSLSFDPPSLLVCINRSSSLHDPLVEAGRFGVNVLGLANRDVADNFMDPATADRFSVGDWEEVQGVPVLSTAQSSLVCHLVHRHEFGTHSLFIGELLMARHRENASPLTYFDRHYIDISAAPGG